MAKTKKTHVPEDVKKMIRGDDEMICELVAPEASPPEGGHFTYENVKSALEEAGLDPDIAHELSPEAAFGRARKKLTESRAIDEIWDNGEEIGFQFTKKFLDSKKDEDYPALKHEPETVLRLNKKTGEIKCKNKAIRQVAEQEFDHAKEARETSDITGIVKKIYKGLNGRIIPFNKGGGTYIVMAEHKEVNDKVEQFLSRLNGSLKRLEIGKSSKRNVKEVAHSYAEDLFENRIGKLKTLVEGFTVNSKSTSIKKAAEEYKELRMEIASKAALLREMASEANEALDEIDEELRQQIEKMAEAKKDEDGKETKTVKQVKIFGQAAKRALRWMGLNDFSYKDMCKVLEHFGADMAESTIKSWSKRGEPGEYSDAQIEKFFEIIAE